MVPWMLLLIKGANIVMSEDLIPSGFIQRFNANLLGIGKTNVINGKY